MEREFRNRPQGMLFFLFFFVTLLFSGKFRSILINPQPFDSEIIKIFLTIASASIAILSSEGVGFLFSTLIYAVFNMFGGYSKWFRNGLSTGNYKKEILEKYDVLETGKTVINADQFNRKIKKISDEAFFVYAFWYYDQKNENKLDAWHVRRYTAFFTCWSSVLAITTGFILATATIIFFPQSQVSIYYYIWLTIWIFLIAALIINALEARKTVLSVIDLWIAGVTNEKFRKVIKEIHLLEKESEGESPETVSNIMSED